MDFIIANRLIQIPDGSASIHRIKWEMQYLRNRSMKKGFPRRVHPRCNNPYWPHCWRDKFFLVQSISPKLKSASTVVVVKAESIYLNTIKMRKTMETYMSIYKKLKKKFIVIFIFCNFICNGCRVSKSDKCIWFYIKSFKYIY